jgi:hypothetical protein
MGRRDVLITRYRGELMQPSVPVSSRLKQPPTQVRSVASTRTWRLNAVPDGSVGQSSRYGDGILAPHRVQKMLLRRWLGRRREQLWMLGLDEGIPGLLPGYHAAFQIPDVAVAELHEFASRLRAR